LLQADFVASAGFTILFGASGAGKTTLLDCIAGLQRPDAGRVAAGKLLLFDSALRVDIPPERRGVGYLLQTLALFPHLTVEQNVGYGLNSISKTERAARCEEILTAFHIDKLAPRRPTELSGGERQRAALARALVLRPRVLLLDEPLTALDATTKAQILDDLREWNREHRIPILYVTHHREEVFALGENVIALERGRIVAQGTPHAVMHRPELETVAQLVGFENIFQASVMATHAEQGTMTCRIQGSSLELEVPVCRLDAGRSLSIGIRAGDILVACRPPEGLSARNVLPGMVVGLEQRDVMVIAKVNCGAEFEVHLTPAARSSLQLESNRRVWLVIKTYSCQVLQNSL